jgi:hypothetical protein
MAVEQEIMESDQTSELSGLDLGSLLSGSEEGDASNGNDDTNPVLEGDGDGTTVLKDDNSSGTDEPNVNAEGGEGEGEEGTEGDEPNTEGGDEEGGEGNTPEPTAIDNFYSELGEEEGIDISEYENTLDGAAKLGADVVTKRSKTLASQIVKDTFEAYPALAKLYKHSVLENKSLDTFLLRNHQSDYSKIDTGTEEGQKLMLSHYYKNVNKLDDNSTSMLVKGAEDSGELAKRATDAKASMDAIREANITKAETEESERMIAQKAEDAKLVEQIKTSIRSRQVGDFKLTTSKAKEFESQMINDPNSVQKAYDGLTFDQKLMLDYLTLNIKDVGSILGNRAKSSKKQSLDNAFNKNKGRKGVGDRSIKNSNNTSKEAGILDMGDMGNLNLEALAMQGEN